MQFGECAYWCYVLTHKLLQENSFCFLSRIFSLGKNIKILRIKETITNDCETNSPCRHHRKCMGNSEENMHSDVKV